MRGESGRWWLAAYLAAGILSGGCAGTDSPEVTERWVVIERSYTPRQHATGISTRGSVVFTSTQEVWGIVFQTPHGVVTKDDKEWFLVARPDKAFDVKFIHNSVWGDRLVEYKYGDTVQNARPDAEAGAP